MPKLTSIVFRGLGFESDHSEPPLLAHVRNCGDLRIDIWLPHGAVPLAKALRGCLESIKVIPHFFGRRDLARSGQDVRLMRGWPSRSCAQRNL